MKYKDYTQSFKYLMMGPLHLQLMKRLLTEGTDMAQRAFNGLYKRQIFLQYNLVDEDKLLRKYTDSIYSYNTRTPTRIDDVLHKPFYLSCSQEYSD